MAARFPFRPRGTQPKEDTTPKKGFRRYLLELKESNIEFWTYLHAPLKLLSLVYWFRIDVLLGWERSSEIE